MISAYKIYLNLSPFFQRQILSIGQRLIFFLRGDCFCVGKAFVADILEEDGVGDKLNDGYQWNGLVESPARDYIQVYIPRYIVLLF